MRGTVRCQSPLQARERCCSARTGWARTVPSSTGATRQSIAPWACSCGMTRARCSLRRNPGRAFRSFPRADTDGALLQLEAQRRRAEDVIERFIHAEATDRAMQQCPVDELPGVIIGDLESAPAF